MIQTAVLSDALAEAVISANIQPLLRRSFGEGRFRLYQPSDVEFQLYQPNCRAYQFAKAATLGSKSG